jgi:hypothetical protein
MSNTVIAEQAIARLSLHRERFKRVGLVVAVLLFCGGLFFSVLAVPDLAQQIRPAPLILLLLIGPPLTMVHSATEFWLTAQATGNPVKWRSALEVTIFASAANMLSMPGGFATRIAALCVHGTSLARGSVSILLFAAIWGGLAFCYSGTALALQGTLGLAALFVGIGVAILSFSAAGFARMRVRRSLPVMAALMRLAYLPFESILLILAAWGIGATIGIKQASVLVVSSFLGLAVSIVPAGLGIREAVIAALSPAIGIAPAVGFLAGAAGRIVYMLGQAIAAIVLLMVRVKQPAPNA